MGGDVRKTLQLIHRKLLTSKYLSDAVNENHKKLNKCFIYCRVKELVCITVYTLLFHVHSFHMCLCCWCCHMYTFVFLCVFIYERVCGCVCVCERETLPSIIDWQPKAHTATHWETHFFHLSLTHVHTCICTHARTQTPTVPQWFGLVSSLHSLSSTSFDTLRGYFHHEEVSIFTFSINVQLSVCTHTPPQEHTHTAR